MERQVENMKSYLIAQGKPFEIITDIGSGKYIAELNDCAIEVVDNTSKTDEQELVEDMIQIVTAFSCKLQGKRANKVKKMIKELTEND